MSHFLTRLVGRTRGTVPMITPVISSRFESKSSGMAFTPESTSSAVAEPTPSRSAFETKKGIPSPPPLIPNQDKDLNRPESGTIDRSTERGFAATLPTDDKARSERLAPPLVESERSLTGKPHHSSQPSPSLATRNREQVRPTREDTRSAAPIVRITIGSIEVHASPPVAPSARKPSSAPRGKLTLDAYLKSRAGGGAQ